LDNLLKAGLKVPVVLRNVNNLKQLFDSGQRASSLALLDSRWNA
jgi:hypothetical protein